MLAHPSSTRNSQRPRITLGVSSKRSSVTRNEGIETQNHRQGIFTGFQLTSELPSSDLINQKAWDSNERPPVSKLSIQISQKLQHQKLMQGVVKAPQSTTNAQNLTRNSFLNHTMVKSQN